MKSLRSLALIMSALLAPLFFVPAAAGASAAGPRPDFRLPFQCNKSVSLTTYVGHNPDDKKIDMFPAGQQAGTPIVASADGYIHELFNPGGLEIRHGGGWFTVYLHMTGRRGVGPVSRGDIIGYMGNVGTGVAHLHYEQLYNPNSESDGDNQHIVNPVIQGQYISMDPNRPFSMVSTNCGGSAPPTPAKYWVDTFADAPGYSYPGGPRTGTLFAGLNYVYCKRWGPNVQVGSSFNHWWLRTDLDTGNPWQNQWVSAYYLSRWGNDVAKDNSGVVIADCPAGT
ncbi:M23 family metallopeptidase [Sphaerisporangium aureirubrum]|uniref:M23 family metallopeptidase n=1 Tax=Sphaerisporangium aureirubrum TaxID=1544736 RepID=A0ABW1NW57_9ACTN